MTTISSGGAGRSRRKANAIRRTKERELRWQQQRLAVPYRTDGPKVTLGLAWFAAVVVAAWKSPYLLLGLAGMVAVVAGLQSGHAWARYAVSDRRASAALTLITALGALAGTFGLGLAVILATFAAAAYGGFGLNQRSQPPVKVIETLIRTSIPIGLAAGSLGALSLLAPQAALALVLMVSAYSAADFLVGTGSANAIEGPVAGIVTLAVVAYGLYLFLPEPFDARTFPLFAALAAICCPVGQIAASAILPRGDAWAPALRRLDSYLLAAPLWLLLI